MKSLSNCISLRESQKITLWLMCLYLDMHQEHLRMGTQVEKTVQDRRKTHITVKRIPPEEYGNYLLTS